ncbi:hypothetical protein [Emticicia agri]|uniref:Lipoprotein n=1 Tax=Emticicia agri TaxID=2492393 RepID=A0A4Q5M4A4_9BACT|nr:hypothetical protein [Emticicia agri]RYU97162.1 hypothetical protein EWM59_02400 [Emticicia agri]
MKKLFTLLVLLSLLVACSSRNWHSNTHKEVYNYARKVERKPSNDKFNERLQLAYKEQKDKLLIEIENLKQIKQAFYWEKVHDNYRILNEMASRIRDCVVCLNKVTPVYYETEQLEALENATDNRVEAGLLALGLNTKPNAQKAYYSFMKAKKLSPKRTDIDSLINESVEVGTVRIVLEGDYKYDKSYVQEIERDLLRSLPVAREAKPFYQFFSPEEATENHIKPDYIISFGYEYLNVGFENRNCSEESFSKDIKVGEKKIDSVKVEPIYEKVSGKIVKCVKSVKAEGRVWFKVIDYKQDEVILRDSFYDDDNWVNEWVTVSGDARALPAGAVSSGTESFAPSRWTQFDNITDELCSSVSWKIRQFIRRQNSLALN